MEIIYLSRQDVESLNMSMKEVLQAVEEGFRLKGLGQTEMPPKPGIHTRPDCFIHAMPAYVRGEGGGPQSRSTAIGNGAPIALHGDGDPDPGLEAAGLKWVSGYPPNAAKGLPYITGLLILNDPETGVPIAVMDCAWVTAMRTGASAGISAKHLAAEGSRVVGIVGCGVQARTSVMALMEVLPDIGEIRCRDILPEATKRFIAELSARFPRVRFRAVGQAAEAARGADIVVTAIPIVTQPAPPLDAGALREGGLAVSLDYDSAWTSAAMKQCQKFVCDDTPQLLGTKEHGVYFSGIPDRIHGDLGEIVAGVKPGRQNAGERIFSMNMGIAIDDVVTARVLYQRAIERKAGIRLPL